MGSFEGNLLLFIKVIRNRDSVLPLCEKKGIGLEIEIGKMSSVG